MLMISMLTACTSIDVPIATTATILAAGGGTVELDDGAIVAFPPGAFAADTQVTLRRETCGGVFAISSFAGCLYSVDAPGLLGRYVVSVPARDEDTVQIVQSAGDGLRPVFDSTSADGVASGTSAQPASFTARVAAANPADDRCAAASFEACGGAIEGEWELEQGCGTIEQLVGVSWEGPDPYAACAPFEALVDYPFTVRGTLDFGGDGTLFATTSATVLKHEMITMECLNTVDETCLPDCTRENGVCDCVWDKASGDSGREAGWVYGDVGVVEIDEWPSRYCVTGDELIVEYTDQAGAYVINYRRK